MSDSDEPEPTVKVEDEALRVERWRLGELEQAGFSLDQAQVLARRLDVDLHNAVALVTVAHCSPNLALRILL